VFLGTLASTRALFSEGSRRGHTVHDKSADYPDSSFLSERWIPEFSNTRENAVNNVNSKE